MDIAKADVERLSYRRLDKPPVAIDRVSARITVARGTADLRKIVFAVPQARVEGSAAIGLTGPYLRTNMNVFPAASPGGMDRIEVRMKLGRGGKDAVAEGSMTVTALAKGSKQIEMESDLGLFRKSIVLNKLQIKRPGKKGTVAGTIGIELSRDGPLLRAALGLRGLDLSREGLPFANMNGALRIDGKLEAYKGRLSLSNEGASWRGVALTADFEGMATGIEAGMLHADWLGGTIAGSARASWKEGVSASASLEARELQPSLVNAGWTGVANLDINGTLRMAANRAPYAALSLRLRQSRLLGQSLQGEMKARMLENDIALDSFKLTGKGFALRAAGREMKGIGFLAKVSDLGLLDPAYKGRVTARGTVLKSGDLFSGSIAADATGLAAYGLKATSLRLTGSVGNDKEHTLQADLTVEKLFYNTFHADALKLSASGTVKDHELRGEARSKKHLARVKLTGGYREGAWQGRIAEFSGSDPESRWKAAQPADLVISPKLVSLSRLVIASTEQESIEVEARLTREPQSGTASLEWKNFDISRANAWLAGVSLSGTTSGSVNAQLEGEIPSVTGRISLSRAMLRRRVQNAELKAEISSSEMSVSWQGPALDMKLSLVLAGYGTIDGDLRIPLPARLPLTLAADGQLRGALKGRISESGTLSFLFPGLVQESRGEIELDLAVAGTWKAPAVTGSFLLDKAGGYFPAAGIHLADLRVEARLEKDAVRIPAFRARSGSGAVLGKAILKLEGWSVASYEGSLQGERFQALFLPQMRVLISPNLRFSGTKNKATVRGEVRVPEFLVYGPPKEAAIKPSEDVVIAGQPEKREKGGQLAMDVEVKLLLGDRVIVKAEGADAQLKGELLVSASSLDRVIARGEISAVKGKYSAYGVGLDITRGRVLFAGGPVDDPSLDILAVKTVNEVKAGVQVTGTARKPVVKLYSQPAMTDADILSYMVLGHALGAQDKEQTTALMKAAGALLSAGQSTALQDQVKQRLGLDVIGIETGGGNTARSLVTIGKYLSPMLYVSYGRALFTGENLFKLRYKIGKRLELESHGGESSGVDLYYTIQFD